MGRIANFLGRAAPVIGGYFDYQQSKAAGDDDIRAIANAAGSTGGGWAGTAAGATAGASIGAIGGPIGIGVGGFIGGLAGSITGSGVGGWLTDRLDETIRGKNLMNLYDRNGNLVHSDNLPEPDQNQTDLLGLSATGAVGTTAAMAARNLAKYGTNPNGVYNVAKEFGLTNSQALKATGGSMIDDLARAGSRLPGWSKVLASVGLGYLANKAAGNPVGKVIDTVSGQQTNFDNDPVNAQKQQQLQRLRQDQDNGYNRKMEDLKLQQMRNNSDYRFIEENILKAQQRQQENEQKLFNRDRQAQLENSRYNLSATLGRDLMNNWNTSAQNVNAAMQTIGRASFL